MAVGRIDLGWAVRRWKTSSVRAKTGSLAGDGGPGGLPWRSWLPRSSLPSTFRMAQPLDRIMRTSTATSGAAQRILPFESGSKNPACLHGKG